uniref:Receptor expression-enhancing protein n=1 Tax=Caenorhabditis tropicalis TaxID=1561998 RepID=A0A1I7V3G5_9PELO
MSVKSVLKPRGGSVRSANSSGDGIQKLHDDLITWLYADHGAFYNENVKKLEESTGSKREVFAYGLIGLSCIYMIVGSAAEFMCNLIGVAYPAYVSVKAIRTEGTDDDTLWLIYWTVFGAFSIIDYFAMSIMSYFPIYWVAKAAFLLYLYLPQTHGSRMIYHAVIDPLVAQLEKSFSGKLPPPPVESVPPPVVLDANNNVSKPSDQQPPPQ